MASRVVMPKLTDTMEEGVVVKWKKHEGDSVSSGDVLAEIETDKAVMDLEAFASGTLRRVLVNEGETVKAGALIAVIAEPDEDMSSVLTDTIAPAPGAARGPEPKKEQAAGPAIPASPASSLGEEKGHIKASPRAKAMAAERGIDLSTLRGSGPGGRIVEEDVMKASAASVPRATGDTDRPLSQMRKAIARTTTQSKAPVPHFYLTTEIAMEEAEKLRAQLKQSHRPHPSLTDMIVKAAALALTRHPEINVSYAGDMLRQHGSIDIGIAVGLDDGLIAPILRDCGSKTLEDIATESRELIERARNKRLQPHEYTGATFSVSNLGMFEVENFIAVIMPPEAAAIAVGAVRDVAITDAGGVKAGRRMKVTLSCDHRALDGVQGAQFLKEFKRILEHPQELIQT
ncbi:MAG TPA: dihydrolipoamide acetyltransferase family protein [Nitrospiraceae bacterium]|nr:dihydrolipoamide acetyltransferase family protein [Nitrospiraceae bacterium]